MRVEVVPAAGGAPVKINRVVELSSLPTRDDVNNKRIFLYVDAQVPAKGDFQVTVHAVKKSGADFRRPDDGYVTLDPAMNWRLLDKAAVPVRMVPEFSYPIPGPGAYTLTDEDKEEFLTFGGTDKPLTAVWIEMTGGGKYYCDYCVDKTAQGINVWHAVFTTPPVGNLVAANTDGESVKITLV